MIQLIALWHGHRAWQPGRATTSSIFWKTVFGIITGWKWNKYCLLSGRFMINEKTVFFSKLWNHIFYRKSGIWSGKVKKDGWTWHNWQEEAEKQKEEGRRIPELLMAVMLLVAVFLVSRQAGLMVSGQAVMAREPPSGCCLRRRARRFRSGQDWCGWKPGKRD